MQKEKKWNLSSRLWAKLRGSNGARERGSGICSSEEELNNIIKSYQYRIQHESIPLNEEKQILREIKLLEGTREKVIANAVERAKIQDSLGEREAIQDQVRLIGGDLDGVRKEKQVISVKLKEFDEEKAIVEKDIKALEDELTAITENRDRTFENIKEMRKKRDKGNSPFYQNRTLLTEARVLAAKKDVEALKELANTEVENFMSLWNSDKPFRDDYEKRILPFLDMRQLSRDGRMRNSSETPLVAVHTPGPHAPESVKKNIKQLPKDNIVISPQDDSSDPKVDKTDKSAKTLKERNKKTEKIDPQEKEEVFYVEKKDFVPKVDEQKLKKLKKEEEMKKRIQTEERKKKLAEKAAEKAAIKAQKEAEKKLKDREKRAKKKNVTCAIPEQPLEPIPEVTEPENIDENLETAVPHKTNDRRENPVRHRARTKGGQDSLSRALHKRKKADNYWLWAGVAAIASVILLLLVIGYSYKVVVS